MAGPRGKFHHEEQLRGDKLTQVLGSKLVTICGCGTNGSNLLETLARQGFSKLRVIDMDRVEEHNLGPQIFEEGDIGQLKVTAAQNRVFRAVGVEVETENKEVKKGTIKKLLRGSDLVVDCFDNRAGRLLLQEYCREQNIPLLHTGVTGDYGEVVWDADYMVPADEGEDNCDYPLARNLAMLVVTAASEEVLNFCLESKPRMKSWAITLGDMKISPYK